MPLSRVGFLGGCRPLIGVDGCHLKGPYPGACLVAVGMDGNNNIYPIAWAVVEVENGASWNWFLKLLLEDLGKQEGAGLTFMSDRQKGLLDAFANVCPKSEIRYCARHIWANLKLQFPGQAYKDSFWAAARCTSKVEFERHLAEIKSLNPKAYDYLNGIPPQHWSRHAFSTFSKSNMLLNNMCESFNAVLKEARDKPVISLMEWVRKYVMKRRFEKKEGAKGLEDRLMPYVQKFIKWAENESRFCTIYHSDQDEFEVEHRGVTNIVNFKAKTCGCFHWELSGLPCLHVIACVLDNRGDVEDYVHQAYTKDMYLKAYENPVAPMPSVNQWEKVNLSQPLPPPFKRMPGRPNQKKRRKEQGEGSEAKKPKLRRACKNCGQQGHNKKTCKNPTVTKEPTVKPYSRSKNKSEWSKLVNAKTAARKSKMAYNASVVRNTGDPSASNFQPTTQQNTRQVQATLSQASVNAPSEKL